MISQTIHQIKYLYKFTFINKFNKKNYSHNGIPVLIQKIIAVIAVVLLSPILLATALLIKIEGKGPIIFSQIRVGENGRYFKMYKFRSMYLKNDPRYKEPRANENSRDGVCKKYINDPRVTTTGKFIRKFSIDELPQLLNIINGDMCLVGPRPALVEETHSYDATVQPRLFAKPGLTGLWQVSGRADINFEQQVVLDKLYIKQQSFINDLKIILLTIPAVLMSKGAY